MNNTVKMLKVLKDADWCPLGFHKSLTNLYAGRNHTSKSKEIHHFFRNTPKKTSLQFVWKSQKQNLFYCCLPGCMAFLLRLGTQQAPPKQGSPAHTSLSWTKERKICPGQQSASRSAPSLVHIRKLEEVLIMDNKPRTLMEVICCSSES